MARQITKSDFEENQKKLAYLKREGREEIAQRLQEARSHGDLSENAEYDEARNDQAKLEEEIDQLEKFLANVEVVEDDFFVKGVVHVGSIVEIVDGDEVMKCVIGSNSDDPDIIAVSDDSPVGQAVLGKKKGDVVSVALPNGEVVEMKVKSTTYKKK